jgi:hypothetical protein
MIEDLDPGLVIEFGSDSLVLDASVLSINQLLTISHRAHEIAMQATGTVTLARQWVVPEREKGSDRVVISQPEDNRYAPRVQVAYRTLSTEPYTISTLS